MATQTQPTRRKRPAPSGNGRMIALLISVVLVLAVTAILASESLHAGQPAAPAASKEPAQGEQFTVAREPSSVTLMAVGDDLMHITCVNAGKQADGSYDFNYMFDYFRDCVQSVDLACINQETPFVNDPAQYSNYPCFGGPTAIGDALVETGFDVVTHATNHIWDKGEVSFYDTLNFWKKYPNVTVLGIHETQEDAKKIRTVNKNGIVISFLNYTYGLNGFVATEDWMVDLLDDKDRIADDIARAKACSDILIVFAHWGTEYMFEPVQDQLDWAQFFADKGVDVVIGGHPHVLEPLDVVTGKNGNKMICYYSLGNFISHQSNNYQMLGGMASLTITKDDDGTRVTEYALEPTMTWIKQGQQGKLFYGMRLRDYTDDMAAIHTVPSCGVQTMWDLYYDIVGDTPEAQVPGTRDESGSATGETDPGTETQPDTAA